MTSKIGPKEQELRQQREARAKKKWIVKPGSMLAELLEHPANVETKMLYGKTQTMGIVSKKKKK